MENKNHTNLRKAITLNGGTVLKPKEGVSLLDSKGNVNEDLAVEVLTAAIQAKIDTADGLVSYREGVVSVPVDTTSGIDVLAEQFKQARDNALALKAGRPTGKGSNRQGRNR